MPSALEIARLTVAGLFALVLTIAAWSDIKDRRIPNWTVLALVVLFIGWAFAEHRVSIVSSLEASGISLFLGIIFYIFKVMGAGDSKLIAAVALFVGMGNLAQFALTTALAGGAIAAVTLLSRPTRALVMFQLRGQGDYGRGIPYGVAIAIGGVATVFSNL